MSSNPFHLVDVFAERKYAGNQLAVVEGGESLSDAEMQAIAAEMNYSETTFIESTERREGGYDVRIFTPRAEVPFAGHPTLGTAAVLRDVADAGDEVVLNLEVGQIPVDVRTEDEVETLWMRQNAPTFGETFDHGRFAEMLSVSESALDDDWPVQAVSTGLPTVIVPLVDHDALSAAETNRQAYNDFVTNHEAKNVLAFCPDPNDERNDLAVRVFADYYGVPEDPATGSSNGCLVSYLARHRYFGDSTVDVRVEQGVDMGRPSLLFLRARDAGDEVEVSVGGHVVSVAEGRLL